MQAERVLQAMGTDCLLTTIGGPAGLVDELVDQLNRLEQLWSRFDPLSEVSAMNARAGTGPIPVSPLTYRLVATSVQAWRSTTGRFDPTVLYAMLINGYDTSFEQLSAKPTARTTSTATARLHVPAPGCSNITLDEHALTVELPLGVGIDPGGIGKGLAADLLADAALDGGASGALIDLGGDIKAVGTGPDDGLWIIDVSDPWGGDEPLLHLAATDIAIATSSRLKRRWTLDGHDVHHLVDPATGEPTATDVVAATAITQHGWWSEALTKSAFVTGELVSGWGVSMLLTRRDHSRLATPDLLELMS